MVIFNAIRAHGKQSIRSLAARTGLATSSGHRHLQAIGRRDRSPESSLWDTAAGRAGLIRLVVATRCVFGLNRGVGAETLSEFFGRLRLEAPVGCSPRALRRVMPILERLLLETAAAWEKAGKAHGEIRPVLGAVDETFLQRMLLVFMALCSGYVLREEVAADRGFDTWDGGVNDRLKMLGPEVLSRVRARAKALITLAHTGRGCLSIPDVLHLSHDLAKGYSLASFGRLRQATRALDQATQRLETVQHNAQADRAQVAQGQTRVAACATSVHPWQGGRGAWKEHLSHVSRLLHPWRLADATRQTSKEVEEQLGAELQAIETLLETNGLPMQRDILHKVRKPLAGIAALGDVWWQTVPQDVAQRAMPPRWIPWADEVLLPLMDWHEPRRRTRCPVQKAQLALGLQAVAEAFERHACPGQLKAEVLADWKAWAAEHVRALQRASSAVEGRHGSLSQMQHNHRGFPLRRSQGWTALHHFDCRAADGTTPASRFFRRSFPDLFESGLSQLDELPVSRQRRQVLALSD